MPNEITVNISGSLLNGNLREVFGPGAIRLDQDAIGAHGPVVTVGFAGEEDLLVGDVTVLGWVFLQNLDATNYVTYGPKSGTMVPMGRLEPGEVAAFRLEPGITLTWQANVADVQVKVLLLED